MVFYLNNYTRTADMVAAVNKIRYGGYWPNLPAALAAVRSDVFAPSNGARQEPSVLQLAVVFVTETLSRYRPSTLDEARAAANMGVGIVTVGVGTFVDRQLLASITSYPSDKNLFIVPSVRNVSDLVYPIKRIICSGTFCYDEYVRRFIFVFSEPSIGPHTQAPTFENPNGACSHPPILPPFPFHPLPSLPSLLFLSFPLPFPSPFPVRSRPLKYS